VSANEICVSTELCLWVCRHALLLLLLLLQVDWKGARVFSEKEKKRKRKEKKKKKKKRRKKKVVSRYVFNPL